MCTLRRKNLLVFGKLLLLNGIWKQADRNSKMFMSRATKMDKRVSNVKPNTNLLHC